MLPNQIEGRKTIWRRVSGGVVHPGASSQSTSQPQAEANSRTGAYAAHQLSGRGLGKSIQTRCSRRLAGWAPHRLHGNCANRRILHCFGANGTHWMPSITSRIGMSSDPSSPPLLPDLRLESSRPRHLHRPQCPPPLRQQTRNHRSPPLPREHKQRRQSLEETNLKRSPGRRQCKTRVPTTELSHRDQSVPPCEPRAPSRGASQP